MCLTSMVVGSVPWPCDPVGTRCVSGENRASENTMVISAIGYVTSIVVIAIAMDRLAALGDVVGRRVLSVIGEGSARARAWVLRSRCV